LAVLSLRFLSGPVFAELAFLGASFSAGFRPTPSRAVEWREGGDFVIFLQGCFQILWLCVRFIPLVAPLTPLVPLLVTKKSYLCSVLGVF